VLFGVTYYLACGSTRMSFMAVLYRRNILHIVAPGGAGGALLGGLDLDPLLLLSSSPPSPPR
jgi:hypothetical protein